MDWVSSAWPSAGGGAGEGIRTLGILLMLLGLAARAGGVFAIYAGVSRESRTCRDCGYEPRGDGWSHWKVWGG